MSQLICVLVCCESQRTHRVGSCFAFHVCTYFAAAAVAAAPASLLVDICVQNMTIDAFMMLSSDAVSDIVDDKVTMP